MSDEIYTGVESEEERRVDENIKKEDAGARGRSWRWLMPLLLGTGLGVAIAGISTRLVPQAKTTPTPPAKVASAQAVTLATATTTRIARTLDTTGTVAARERILVLPQTSGLQIKKILVDEGRQVKAGEVLAILDDSVLQTQIDQARAKVQSDQGLLEQKKAILIQSNTSVAQARANELQVQASAKDAQQRLKNYQKLASDGAISREQLADRETAAATSTASAQAAAEAVNGAKASIAVAQGNINSITADVRNDLAKVQQLQAQLAQTIVRAPVAGTIAKKNVEVGDVTATKQLFEMVRDGTLELQAQVPEVQLSQISVGQNALISSDTDNRIHLEGKVREISPLVDEKTRKAIVKIALPANSLLRSGMFARAKITTNTGLGVAVPSKAVLPQPDGKSIVFTLSGEDKVKAIPVQVGEILIGGNVEIQQGLTPGDRVVIEGGAYLKDGDRIQVVVQ